MKKALTTTTKERQPQEVVAVPSLMPEYALWNTATNTLKAVYGGNTAENSVYTEGPMPKMFRIAAEDESYHNELILQPLPANIEETVLAESPECKLVIMNCQPVQLPEVKPRKQECKVIQHPAVEEAKAAKMCRQKPVPGQFFIPFPDVEPKNMTA